MKNMITLFTNIIPFLDPYPFWIKLLFSLSILLLVFTFICLILFRPNSTQQEEKSQTTGTQSVLIQKSSQSNVYQASGDINIYTTTDIPLSRSIYSITVEVRLTCDLKEGAELPPSEVNFIPIGDSHAYFQGTPGKIRLNFKSPVYFRKQGGNKIIVTNNFSLDSGSYLQNRPFESLKNYDYLSVPVVTVVYGKSLAKFTLLEISLTINGKDVWYSSYKYDIPFKQVPRFEIPLTALHEKL